MLYWICSFLPLFLADWKIAGVILSGSGVGLAMWEWGCRRVKKQGDPDCSLGLGWIALCTIVQAAYLAVAVYVFDGNPIYYFVIIYCVIVFSAFLAFLYAKDTGLAMQAYQALRQIFMRWHRHFK